MLISTERLDYRQRLNDLRYVMMKARRWFVSAMPENLAQKGVRQELLRFTKSLIFIPPVYQQV